MYKTLNDYMNELPQERVDKINKMTEELLKEVTVREFRWTLDDVPKPSQKKTKAEENGEVPIIRIINIADLEKFVKKIGGEIEVVIKLPHKKRIKVQRAESKPGMKLAAKKAGKSKQAVKSASVVSAAPAAGKRKGG